MTALRELRRAADLSQQEMAALIDVPVNTFRMWDSGLRPVPPHVLQIARVAVMEHARNTELLSLDQPARELGVHQRTLRAAAGTGRLRVTFASRSAFGRPIRLATRAAGQSFMRKDYRRYGGQSPAVAPLPSVPQFLEPVLHHDDVRWRGYHALKVPFSRFLDEAARPKKATIAAEGVGPADRLQTTT